MDEKQSFSGNASPAPMPEQGNSEKKEAQQASIVDTINNKPQQTELPSLKDLPIIDEGEKPVINTVGVAQQTASIPQEAVPMQQEEPVITKSESESVEQQISESPDDVPAPPEQDISIRTMSSDMDALKEGGGVPTEPAKFRPVDLHNEEKVFEPHTTEKPVSEEQDPDRKKYFMKIMVGVGAFVIVGVLLGYFLIVPLLKPQETPEPEVYIPQAEPEASITEPSSPLFQHTSFFAQPVDLQGTVTVSSVSLEEMKGALNALTKNNQTNNIIQEISFLQGESPMNAYDFLSVMLPEADHMMTARMLKNDFTGFVYYDENGIWTGYIFELSDEAVQGDMAQSRNAVDQMFETATTLDNFFVSSAGAAQTYFKDGSLLEESRYKTYSAKGASFNYGWHGNYVVVSTSYSGFKAVAPLVK